MSNEVQSTRYIPLTDWSRFHSWPSQSGLRYLVFNAKQNGFDRVIRRAGRRILISEQDFFLWLESKKQEGC